jgi:hypothetical protein
LALTVATITWSPGIGDPSLMGWLTVAAYLAAAIVSRSAGKKAFRHEESHVSRFWYVLTVVLFCLALNKQLDLQSLFTQVGKELFKAMGMYESRRAVQVLFIFILGMLTLFLVCLTFWYYRREFRRLRLPLVGIVLLVSFVVIRAASFHHVDLLLKRRLAGWRVNWIFELGGILLVFLGGIFFLRAGSADREDGASPERNRIGGTADD